jgi:hypothetical protein
MFVISKAHGLAYLVVPIASKYNNRSTNLMIGVVLQLNYLFKDTIILLPFQLAGHTRPPLGVFLE